MEIVEKPDTGEGLVVIAEEQTKGKGQRGNVWQSEKGKNLTLSVLLKPSFLKVSDQFFLNIITSLAVYDTIVNFLSNSDTKIKWPNDVLIERQKACGILIENTLRGSFIDSSVVGIGLNVNQTVFHSLRAKSLRSFSNQDFDRYSVFETLLENLEAYYLQLKAGNYENLKEAYLSKLYGYKTPIKLKSEFEFSGMIEDVKNSGLLMVSSNGKTQAFDFKELTFLL